MVRGVPGRRPGGGGLGAPRGPTVKGQGRAERAPETAETLTEVLRRRAALSGEQPYFHLYGEAVTYGRLWELSARYAAALPRAGVPAGDKVCLIYPTCAEFFYTFFGALRPGAAPGPLYPTLRIEATANLFPASEAVAQMA